MVKIAKCLVFGLCTLLPLILVAQEPQKNEGLEWIKIGMTAQVNNDSFYHVFHINKNAGRFSKLDLRSDGNLKLDKVIVEYEDGTSWSSQEYYKTLLRWSYLFENPYSDKRIKTVEVRFHDVYSIAAIDLWGGCVKAPK
jgi:hypothetical protein